MCETRLEPKGGVRVERGPVAAFGELDRLAGSAGPTPARILARLAPDPGEVPEGYTPLIGDDVTIGLLLTGDWLGIDGRWCLVVGCTSVNGWVSVDTAHGHPSLPGAVYLDASVHLARNIDLEGVEV